MDKILILFLIGIAVGIFVPIIENRYQSLQLLDEPLTAIQQIFAAGTHLWYPSNFNPHNSFDRNYSI